MSPSSLFYNLFGVLLLIELKLRFSSATSDVPLSSLFCVLSGVFEPKIRMQSGSHEGITLFFANLTGDALTTAKNNRKTGNTFMVKENDDGDDIDDLEEKACF